MSEFTGERVIPGEVNDDLLAEHLARYKFAARFCAGKRALDIGCGSGYGTAELAANAVQAFGIDVASKALNYARENYARANAFFSQASATALPFGDQTFELLTAFEVIEHLADWRACLAEARRILRPDGVFLVSTPNVEYYAESRAEQGPNPFHVHEFDFTEFQTSLAEFFPHVTILLQNWSASIVFSPANQAHSSLEAHTDAASAQPTQAHFFLAVCSAQPQAQIPSFLYLPSAANVLREREHHIGLLERDLEAMTADRNALLDLHRQQITEIEERNQWALQLEQDWKGALARVAQVQHELRIEQLRGAEVVGGYARKVAELESENREKTEWAIETERRLSADLAIKCGELAQTVKLLDAAEATVIERTVWAQRVQESLDTLEAQLQMIRRSRWVRLGRAVGVGPRVEG